MQESAAVELKDRPQEGFDLNASNDLCWGAEAIGQVFNPPLSASRVRYLFSQGAFKGAVIKVGHRTMVGSRHRLQHAFFA